MSEYEPSEREVSQWLACMRAAYAHRDEECRKKFSRSLPFADAMFDRRERAKLLGFAEGATIYNSAVVFGDVQVGEGTWIGPFVMLDGSGGGITIGAWCSISAGTHIYTHDTVGWALSGGKKPPRRQPVSIGSRCYLGSQSVIVAGIEIGECCVVAANSFVNKSVAPRTIVGGTPARRLGSVVFDGDEPRLLFDGAQDSTPL